jgi:multiple antibiotic resistance protein
MIEALKTFLFLIAVIDPLGSVPVFLEATKHLDDPSKKKVAINATLIAACILVFFIVVGQVIMETMHISLSAFQISGGLILFLFSLTMIFGEGKQEEGKHLIKDYSHVTIFPIALPAIASPGAIMAVVLLTDNHQYTILHQTGTTLLVLLVLLVTCLLLLFARKIQHKIGDTGITVIGKIMGLILASFAIQNILTGIKDYFKI